MANYRSALAITLTLGLPTTALADTFDFEAGASFLREDSLLVSTFSVITNPPLPPFPFLSTTSDIEADLTTVSGTWFFSGVSINDGPRSRAAFLSRASSLSLDVGHLDFSARTRVRFIDPTVPDETNKNSLSGDTISLNTRYVWQDNGWYGLAGFETTGVGNGLDDLETFRLGAGKYLGERTSVDLSARYSDTFRSGTEYTLRLSHIGDLNGQWQYGADVVLSQTGFQGSELMMDTAFSLYPSRSVAFGVEIGSSLERFGDDATYDAFMSWFANESIELSARFGTTDFAGVFGNNSANEDRWGLGFRVRF